MLQNSEYKEISEKIMCGGCGDKILLHGCDEYELENGKKYWVCRNCSKLINEEDIGKDKTIVVLGS